MAKGIKFHAYLIEKSLKDSDRAEAYFKKAEDKFSKPLQEY